ncbi:MAG: bifunctional methylenetetrahydrofolate dehydrogenase/methenyltetrahydrofolate cyclohydrolase FolD [Magnetococcales bacterium]|nr:bifunctional methylenetetrahydrofolate dehydrogenase/methenyltetrahydrofolate cyclohydrolase FolD [Magnetococcales bacterium]
MGRIIDGKAIAAELREELRREVGELRSRHGLVPGLAVVLVGEDPASQVYVRGKERACAEVGVASFGHHLPESTTTGELLDLIGRLACDPAVHGILVQLPLPAGIDEAQVLLAIPPGKDADGFHPLNVGQLATGSPTFRPCTPWGVMHLLRKAGVDPKGKEAVVLGRSNIVGKPVAMMLLAAHATVTIVHSRTADLAAQVRRGDIVVAAVGRPRLVRGDWLKRGAVVIDVGINRLADGKLCGDVHFEEALPVVEAITPVPGGVGPMTIAMLVKNTVEGAKRQSGLVGPV